jgi:uncharacterized protein DUF2630
MNVLTASSGLGTVNGVEDDDVIANIDALVDEEHRLYARGAGGEELTDEEHERLKALEVRLDQCWDLLRQRRARRSAGQDPEAAHTRPDDVVEHYQQ